jgi:two-component system cell cycle sensor histidine kinase/response regulator CckA
MASVADSGEAKRVRQALEGSEALQRTLLDSALDCIVCTDGESRITEFNAAAERTFRIPRSVALGKDFAETLLPPNLRDRYRRELFVSPSSASLDVMGNRLEATGMRSDGHEFPAEFTVTKIAIAGKVTFTISIRDITARNRAEEAVVWLAAIVESSQDAIYGGDLNGRLSSWNKGAELMYGYTAEEAIGKNVSFLVPPGRPDELPLLTEKLRTGLRTHNYETVRVAKDGTLLDVSVSISSVLDSAGSLIGVSAIARDITSQKRSEEALQKANETSVYASPIPIVAADANSHITVWNPAAERLFGWTEEEVIGKPNPSIPPGEEAGASALHKRLLSGLTLTGVEVQRRKRDGSFVAVSLCATPLWDANHEVRGIIGFLTDITERKRAEEALRKAEEKYRGIFENAVEGIYQTTTDGKYIAANPALARMLGFDSPEELVNTRSDIRNQEYVNPELREEFVRKMEHHGLVQNFEYQVYRKDGRIILVSESAHAVRDAAGKILHFEGTVQDVTQHRELEQQLRQMQKIEAIGRLAGGVAHDFNNILMAISSYSELLARKLADKDPSHRYAEEILRATNRGSSLTQSLLAFSRKQVISPKVVDLNTLVAEQTEMLKRLIPENIELKFVPRGALGRVKVDPSQIEQVVMNLSINARDAMPHGGEILIETDNAELDAAYLEHTDLHYADLNDADGGLQKPTGAGKYVMLAVSDNGCGMDAETRAHIFEPFFTTKAQGKGTGLGLATVFGIVQQSAGHIFLQSEPGSGTTFKIYLPRVQEEARLDDGAATCNVSVRGDETILLVEDQEAVRESAAEYLADNGYTVFKASRGSEALDIAERHDQPIHLLLTDVVMPQMSGRELSEKITRIHPETKVIFMSGYSNNLLSNRQILDPKHELLQKPFRLAALGQRIREALARREKTREAKAGSS